MSYTKTHSYVIIEQWIVKYSLADTFWISNQFLKQKSFTSNEYQDLFNEVAKVKIAEGHVQSFIVAEASPEVYLIVTYDSHKPSWGHVVVKQSRPGSPADEEWCCREYYRRA